MKSKLEDKTAMEEDEEAFFEIETSKKIHLKDEIRWTQNGRRLDTDDERKYSLKTESKTCKLIIKKIRLEDEGVYTIDINGSRSTAQLTVNELPVKFVKPLRDIKGTEDKSVIFECEISKAYYKKNNKEVIVKWMKGERELRDIGKYTIKRDDVRHTLTIKELAFDDISDYMAMVVNERTTGKLDIIENEVTFTTKLKDIEVTEKENAQFDCEVNKITNRSSEQLPITWYRKLPDGTDDKLYKTSHIEPTRLNKRIVLKINSAVVEDAGVYFVTVGGARAEAKLIVNEIPIVFKNPLEYRTGKEGLSVTFECTINRADKTPKWFVNDKLLTKEDIKSGKYSVSKEKNNFQLSIHNLDLVKDNNAKITCQIGEKAKSNARLTVEEEDIKFIERLVDLGVKENDPAIFVCKLSKLKYKTRPNHEVNIKWFVKNKEVKPETENSRYKIEQIDCIQKLNISSVPAEDAGEVKCQVNGDLYSAANLYVEEEPVVFVRKLADQVCDEIPGNLKFDCELNKSFVNVKWYHNGKEITADDPKYDFGREGPRHFLHIKEINGKDEGEYTIVVQGPSEKKCSANLSVKAAPKLFLNAKYKETITIKRGQPILIEVGFSGHPEPNLSWSANDEPVKDGGRVKIEVIRNNFVSFLMNKTTRSDSGKYQLLLENEYGKEKCQIKVNVLDKPAPPRNPQVSDNRGEEMNVTWTVPEDNGGSPITGYVVEIRDFDRKSWNELITCQPHELAYLATRLTISTRYSFRISAENKYGRSEPAEISSPVEAKYPFNVPDAPQNCKAKDITPTSCTVTFEPPKSDGGSSITGYIVERKQTSTSRWIRLNRDSINKLIYKCNDLTEGLEYEFRIIAENKAGQSEPSDPCKHFIAKNPFDRPSPPLNVKPGEATKASIELNWTVPLSDGGSPITGYRIERRNQKTMKWLPVDGLGRITQCHTVITDVKENKEYEFRVIATNAAGDSDPSASTPLIVAKTKIVGEKPQLLEPMKDQRVLVGATAHFEAKLKAKPPPEIKWYLNERNLNHKDDNFVSTFDNQSLELTINNVQLKDEGIYKVTVKNPLGELDTDAKLTVLKKPAIKYNNKLDKTYDVIAIQQNMHISCEITGSPKPDVKW